MSFRAAIEKFKTEFDASIKDGKVSTADILLIVANGAGVLEGVLRGIGGNQAEFQQLVADCENLVVDYLVPLDLSQYKIPKFVEQVLIDPQLPLSVRPILMGMRNKILPAGS